MIKYYSNKESLFLVFLLGFHFLFVFFNWSYFKENGGDAAFYWFQTPSSASKSFSELLHYGSDFVLLLNYPLAKIIGLDIRFGFFIYTLIGYFGLLQFYRLCKFYLKGKLVFKGFSVWVLVLLLPNLHFWTAGLGKEPLCFLFLSTILLQLSKEKYISVALWISMILLILIRPHIALLLVISVFLVCFFNSKMNLKQRIFMAFVTLVLSSGLLYMFLQLSQIKRLDLERIKRFNEFSLLSFKDSGSYVPIIDYPYPYKVFTFYFRPLFNEIPSFFGIVLGIENVLVLLLHFFAIGCLWSNWKRISFSTVQKIILVFALISGLVIVQRYSGLGIFARTKIMIQPFVCCVLLWILQFKNRKKYNE